MHYDEDMIDDEPPRLKHSGLGIASFLIALGACLLELVIISAAGVLEATTPGGIDENSSVAVLLGLALFGGLFLDLFGIGLGIAALFQSHCNKLFAVLGVVLGSVVLLGVVTLVAVGVLMS
jgi:hypothetical protein